MNAEQAQWFNHGIEAALKEHHKGIGAIRQLKKKFVVTVEHVGTTTKQDVQVADE